MKNKVFNIVANNTDIYGQIHSPKEPRAVVVLVHGMGEHSGRYAEKVVPFLLSQELAVVSYDNFGHGQSGGKRGHCPSYGALMELLDDVVQMARKEFTSIPVLLYGHSMGGNLVLNYLLDHNPNIKAAIVTSPYLRLGFQPPKWKMILGKVMLKLVPSITLPSGLDSSGISRIPSEIEKYIADPLIHDKVSPMFSFPIMEAGERAISKAYLLKVDTLLLHGTADPIIDYHATEEFHRNATKTTFCPIEGGFHELHHDLGSEDFFATIKKWLAEKV